MAFEGAQPIGFGTRRPQPVCRITWFMRLAILAGFAFLTITAGAAEQQETAPSAAANETFEEAVAVGADDAVTPEGEDEQGTVAASQVTKAKGFLARNKFFAAGTLAAALLLCLIFFSSKAATRKLQESASLRDERDQLAIVAQELAATLRSNLFDLKDLRAQLDEQIRQREGHERIPDELRAGNLQTVIDLLLPDDQEDETSDEQD